jgi:hypothetical protein
VTWALLSLLALALTANVTQAIWLRSANKRKDDAELLAMGSQKELLIAQEELRAANLTIKARAAEMTLISERLVTAEQQRNEARADAKKEFVAKLQQANLADAARFVAELVAQPINSGVLPKARLSDHPVDGLLDPNS